VLSHEFVEILLKHRLPEGMDFLEPVRVDEDPLHVVSIISDHAKQLLSGTPVEVAFKTQVQVVAAPVHYHSEIASHEQNLLLNKRMLDDLSLFMGTEQVEVNGANYVFLG
jgi:hypothetical protein